jgi:misacylated tRNA(Ala) deacylase
VPTHEVVVVTELLYLRDADLREFDAVVVAVDAEGARVALDVTAFYPTGGGQPHDTGILGDVPVTDVRKDGDLVWHVLAGDLPAVSAAVRGVIDWERRYQLMRTHSAMHVLCGVIWNEWGKAVTGGNMEPLEGRMDFAFDPLPEGFAVRVEELVNAEIAADRPIEITFLPRDTAVVDEDLIRTAVNLIPESVTEIRVVDIVGLDRQADGGTHVRSTKEIGAFEVVKTESRGRGNKRVRVRIHDAL